MSRDELEFDDDDDDLQLYVAAFREVEQPTPAAHAASWRVIAERTGVESSRRWWLWVGAAATLAAAAWVIANFGGVALQRNAAAEPDLRDQAGYVHGDDSGGDAVARARRAAAPATKPAEAEVEAPADLVVAPTIEPEPQPEPATAAKPARGKPRAATSLADETALFGDIQRALVENQPARALAAIAQHEREFPRGAFRSERIVAKARALCAAGKRDAAKRVRDQFLAQHPSSHLAPSMRSVCAD